VRVGTKNEFVVTWLTNTNFQPGVLGNFPTPAGPWLLLLPLAFWTLLHAASSAPAAAVAPPAPRNFSALLRDAVVESLSLIVCPLQCGGDLGPCDQWVNHSMIGRYS